MRTTYPNANQGLQPGRKRKSNGAVLYTCTKCLNWSSGHRPTARSHVLSRHPLYTERLQSTPSRQRSIASMIASQDLLRTSFNRQKYREAVVGLLTRRRVPFSAVEWSEMRDLALACNPAIEDQLITSRRSAVRLIVANYEFYRNQIKTSLSTASSPIHIATDLWTSPHRHAMLAICAQWVDSEYQLQKALLALPECRYNHTGEHQANLILETLETFDIASNIGWHTGDNATSNDKCLEVIGKRLAEIGLKFEPSKRRIRCIGHIINLSLQAFLLASSKEALRAALAATADVTGEDLLGQFSEALASRKTSESQPQSHKSKRRRRGDSRESTASLPDEFCGVESLPTLRKLHELAVWIRSSSTHADYWDRDVGLRLGIDNTTRWSSWYTVMHNALRKKAEIVQFMTDHEIALGDNRLTAQDWDFLTKAHQFLQPFAGSTLYAEGGRSSISQSLVLMDALLLHYEQKKELYSHPESYDPRMLHAIEMGWFLIDKYYSKTEEAPVYAAALLLDPSRRAAYLKQNWPADWYETSIAAASMIWEEDYKMLLQDDRVTDPLSPPPPPKRPRNQLDVLLKSLQVKTATSKDVDDFVAFIEAQPIDLDGMTPLEWWCGSEQRRRYPRLSQMAIAILSIPAESSEPERTFSGARRTCSWDRLRLSCSKIEMIECIASWLREGHIMPVHLNGLGLPIEEAEDEEDDLEHELIDVVETL